MSPSRLTTEYPTKRIDYNNTYTEDIKTHLIRPGLTYALSVLILNALCVYFFEAFSPPKQFHVTKIYYSLCDNYIYLNVLISETCFVQQREQTLSGS